MIPHAENGPAIRRERIRSAIRDDRAGVQSLPLVFNSPHSGRIYPPDFLAASGSTARRSAARRTLSSTSSSPAVGRAGPLLRANFPRGYLDVNREPYELDPRMFAGRLPTYANVRSVRVAGGLGTIARIVGERGDLPPRFPSRRGCAASRGSTSPTTALRRLLRARHGHFGIAVLVDCHSMPSTRGTGAAPPRRRARRPLRHELRRRAHRCRRGDVPRRLCGQPQQALCGRLHHRALRRPGRGLHALQIEVNRALYIDERRSSDDGFDGCRRHRTLAIGSWRSAAEELQILPRSCRVARRPPNRRSPAGREGTREQPKKKKGRLRAAAQV